MFEVWTDHEPGMVLIGRVWSHAASSISSRCFRRTKHHLVPADRLFSISLICPPVTMADWTGWVFLYMPTVRLPLSRTSVSLSPVRSRHRANYNLQPAAFDLAPHSSQFVINGNKTQWLTRCVWTGGWGDSGGGAGWTGTGTGKWHREDGKTIAEHHSRVDGGFGKNLDSAIKGRATDLWQMEINCRKRAPDPGNICYSSPALMMAGFNSFWLVDRIYVALFWQHRSMYVVLGLLVCPTHYKGMSGHIKADVWVSVLQLCDKSSM